MGLAILSREMQNLETTLEAVVIASYKSRLTFVLPEYRHNGSNRLEVTIQKYAGKENEEWFMMDIIPIEEQKQDKDYFNQGMADLIFSIDGELHYRLAGTDRAPLKLCYDFSLAYLRLCPTHLINIYDDFNFTLKDMEEIERNGGYYEGWLWNK